MSFAGLLEIQEEALEGSEPIHRRLVLNHTVLLTLFGNTAEDRWILGWSPRERIELDEVLWHAWWSFQHAEIPFSAWSLHEESFTKVVDAMPSEPTGNFRLVADTLQMHWPPEMFVLGDEACQVELIFHEGSLVTMTILGTGAQVYSLLTIVEGCHFSPLFRTEPMLLARAADLMLSPGPITKDVYGENQGEWRFAFSAGEPKFG